MFQLRTKHRQQNITSDLMYVNDNISWQMSASSSTDSNVEIHNVDMMGYNTNVSSSEIIGHMESGGPTERFKRPMFYQCDMCYKTFSTLSSLSSHRRIHSDEKPFICHLCNRSFRHQSTLNAHIMSVHSGLRPYQCEVCQKAFSSVGNLKSHRRTHMRENMLVCRQPFKCDVCTKEFSRSSYLVAHKCRPTDPSAKRYTCEVCKKSFTRSSNLARHKHLFHTGVEKNAGNQTVSKSENLGEEVVKHQNLKVDTAEYSHQCNICNKTFSSEDFLITHKLLHRGQKRFTFSHICNVCNRAFCHKGNLIRHIRTHSGDDDKPFLCDVCNKAFSRLNDLDMHARFHTNESPFVCSRCGRGYRTAFHLDQHLNFTPPFKCSECNEEFCHFRDLNKHTRVHTGKV